MDLFKIYIPKIIDNLSEEYKIIFEPTNNVMDEIYMYCIENNISIDMEKEYIKILFKYFEDEIEKINMNYYKKYINDSEFYLISSNTLSHFLISLADKCTFKEALEKVIVASVCPYSENDTMVCNKFLLYSYLKAIEHIEEVLIDCFQIRMFFEELKNVKYFKEYLKQF